MSFEQKEWKNRLSEYPTRRTLTPTDGGTAMTVDVTRAEGTVMQQGDPFNADNMNDLERRIAEGIGGGEDIIAPTEQEQSLNAYTVGQKLIFDGVLYNVISPIAVGNSLVPDVNISATKISEILNTLEDELTANNNRLYMDYQNGKYGINTSPSRGADTFIPFKSAPVNLGQISTYDATSIPGYETLTADNFIVEITGVSGVSTGGAASGSQDDLYADYAGFSVSKSYNASTGTFTLSGMSSVLYLRDTDATRKIRRTAYGSIYWRVWLIT